METIGPMARADRRVVELTSWLRDAAGCDIGAVAVIEGGRENLVIGIERMGGCLVVRVSDRRTVAEVKEELEFVASAAASGLNVASPVPLIGDETVCVTPFGVLTAFDYIGGRHLLNPPATDLETLAHHIVRLGDAAPEWTPAAVRGSRPFGTRIRDDIDQYLRTSIPRTDRRALHVSVVRLYASGETHHLVHGDVNLKNVLWVPRGEKSAPYLIDFDDAYYGTTTDEYFSSLRGLCFNDTRILESRITVLSRIFRLSPEKSSFWMRLAAECLYFFAALIDSAERSGRTPDASHLHDGGRALACLRMAATTTR